VRPAATTGDDELDGKVEALLDDAHITQDRDQIFELVASSLALGADASDRLDRKIANAALKEMRSAFNVFAPYRDVPKATIFGSARTTHEDPLYLHTVELARALAEAGWMVVTGAGPGIMEAGMEGAGREKAIGVLIRLPFEGGANEIIRGDPKLTEMKYFFTRKLMLMKESQGFVALPGGFGTLDETLELLTLVQTGKAEPVPIVLLDTPGGTYWSGFQRFVDEQVAAFGMIGPADQALYRVTDDVQVALEEVTGFYRNYHSLRYVGNRLVLRLRVRPTADEVAGLNDEFGDIVVAGRIERTGPLPPEVNGNDHVDLPRIAWQFDRRSFGRLRSLLDAVNRLPSAPDPVSAPPTVAETPDRG
jgi:uncharacterized protein (TIGR00730 family)